jgi:CRP-like cAMP-binding protein
MGCVDSFFSGEKTKCELKAISSAEVLVFEKDDIEYHIKEDPALFQFYHTLVTTALQEENDFKLKIIAYTSEQLYRHILTHFPVIIQRIPSKYIAEFMGISQEWLSKLKHRIY